MPNSWKKARYNPAMASEMVNSAGWQKSFSSEPNGGNCVEVNLATAGLVGLRDTKLTNSPVFLFDADEWNAFLAGVKAGQFDLDN